MTKGQHFLEIKLETPFFIYRTHINNSYVLKSIFLHYNTNR